MNNLNNFTGTEKYYKGFMGVLLTDGSYFVGSNGASWLISDICVILKINKKVKAEEFVLIRCNFDKNKAFISYEDGNNNVLFKQNYDYTDFEEHFEEKEVKFYYVDNVLMLNSEY